MKKAQKTSLQRVQTEYSDSVRSSSVFGQWTIMAHTAQNVFFPSVHQLQKMLER